MAIKRTSEARWQGSVTDGKGTMRLGSGAYEGAYSFNSRFGDDTAATNPEELIAGAHAGCFSMALSGELGNAGITALVVPAACGLTTIARCDASQIGTSFG